MAITKEKKKEILGYLAEKTKESKSLVFVNFHKLLVKDVSEMRRSLQQDGVDYLVAKKTLLKKAFNEANFKGEMPILDGEVAIAFSDDLIAPARSVYGFQKKFDGKVSILGGVFDGEYKNKDEMLSIALIPSLQTLRGMFVNVINSPIQRLVIAMGQIAEKKS